MQASPQFRLWIELSFPLLIGGNLFAVQGNQNHNANSFQKYEI